MGNDLKVVVHGGALLHGYPIMVDVEKEEVSVDIVGGVGFVPIRFEGLGRAKGYAQLGGVSSFRPSSVLI